MPYQAALDRSRTRQDASIGVLELPQGSASPRWLRLGPAGPARQTAPLGQDRAGHPGGSQDEARQRVGDGRRRAEVGRRWQGPPVGQQLEELLPRPLPIRPIGGQQVGGTGVGPGLVDVASVVQPSARRPPIRPAMNTLYGVLGYPPS